MLIPNRVSKPPSGQGGSIEPEKRRRYTLARRLATLYPLQDGANFF